MKNIKNDVNLCFITDDGYINPTIVALCSIKKNMKETTRYHVYLLCDDVSSVSKEKIRSISSDRLIIECIDMDLISSIRDNAISGITATPSSLYKFYIAEILKDIDRVIFLDGDIIVQEDLSSLYNIDLEGKQIGAVKDVVGMTFVNNGDPNFSYFNSGILLMDLDEMRKNNCASKAMEYRKNGINERMDQDALNYVFKDNVKILPFKWNT